MHRRRCRDIGAHPNRVSPSKLTRFCAAGNIDFRKRELFAYACEAYSCILAAGGTREYRIDALARHGEGELPRDESVDIGEYLGILAESVRSRSGWKVILRRCSPTRPSRLHVAGTRAPKS